MATSKSTIENGIIKFLSPVLIVTVGWFSKNKLESIDNRMAMIETVLIQQGKFDERLKRVEKDVEDLKGKTTRAPDSSPAKHEEIIAFSDIISK